jgi:hypothetical protein
MQMRTFWKRMPLTVVIFLSMALGALNASSNPKPIDLRCDGDDALTQRVCAALKDKFKSSADFKLSTGNEPGILVVTIPTNVDWEQVGKRTKVIYRAVFATIDDQKIDTTVGSCWEDALTKCADQVAKQARVVAHKLP